MKKMLCLFVREFKGRDVAAITEVVTPGCEWVLAGEGSASRKWDGTACAVIGGVLHKRYDAKRGKTPPEGAVPCQDSPDEVTGHWPHWVAVSRDKPEDKHHVAAWRKHGVALNFPVDHAFHDGTYELVGPGVNGNPEGMSELALLAHGAHVLYPPRTFAGLRVYLTEHVIEGVVFAHPDGRMCKIRRDDFGLPWKPGKVG